jgi:polyisoprenoid-binding protein YceI
MPPALRRLRHVAALSLLLPLAALAADADTNAETWRLDPVHTRVMFAISHAGFSNAIGTVSGSTGTLVFDPEDWTTASLKATVPLSRLDLGDAKWNEATLAGNLLDAKDHPTAEFVSGRVEPIAPDRARVHGTLTLRGVAQPLALDVTLNALKRHPLPPFRRTVGFSATATLSRKAFGITAWSSVIGDSVELRIEAEAVRDSGKGDDTADETATGNATDPAPPASS